MSKSSFPSFLNSCTNSKFGAGEGSNPACLTHAGRPAVAKGTSLLPPKAGAP